MSQQKVDKPLEVAVVGTGYFSRFHYAAWKRMNDVSLTAMHAMDRETGEAFQREFDVKHLYTNFDEFIQSTTAELIDVVTPPHTHKSIIERCIKHDKKVICQKPFCDSVAEAAALSKKINEQNALVVVHENFRFQPWYREIKKLLDEKRLGDLYEINFDFRPGDGQGPDAYLRRQPYFQQQKRFFIQETGIHFIDVFRFLLGEITGLSARLSRLNPVIAGEDAGIVIMEFESGARGILNGNRLCDHDAENCRLTMGEMRIEGSLATLYLKGNGDIHTRAKGSNTLITHQYHWSNVDFGGDCVYSTNRHVVDHIQYGKPLQNVAIEYVRNRKVEEAIYQSNDTGSWINLI